MYALEAVVDVHIVKVVEIVKELDDNFSLIATTSQAEMEIKNISVSNTSKITLGSTPYLSFDYSLPVGKKWLINQVGGQPDFWQAFLVDETAESLEDDLKSGFSIYIEKLVDEDGLQRCHRYLCDMKMLSIITKPNNWEFLGSTTYNDAGYTFDSPYSYRYISKENNFAVYVQSFVELHSADEVTLRDTFESFQFKKI